MTSILDYLNKKFLDKAQQPFALRLQFMNELRDIAVQASMYSFVAKEANSADKIEAAKERMGEIAGIIALICPEFLILSRHWGDIQKYRLLKQKWSKREVYKQYKRALKKNNYRYSTEAEPKLFVEKLIQSLVQGIELGLESYKNMPYTQIFEAIYKKILNIKKQHSIVSEIQTEEILRMLNPQKLTDKEILIPPNDAIAINPFIDLFWITVCQIVYLEYAYYSYMLKQLSAPQKARSYLWLGEVRVHLTDGTNDYIIKREEKKKTNRQKIEITTEEILKEIIKEDKATVLSDLSLYIDHEGVKTNMITKISNVIEKSILDGQPSFTRTSFDYWCLCPPGSLCDEWPSPLGLDIEGFYFHPEIECWSSNYQSKPYVQFVFEWNENLRVLAIAKYRLEPSENVKQVIKYEIKIKENNTTKWVEVGTIDVEGEEIDKRVILPAARGVRMTIETIESHQNPLTLEFYGATVMKIKE